MTQHEIFDFLKKREGELYTSEEIAINLDTSKQRVAHSISKLKRLFPICKHNRGNTIYYTYCKKCEHHMRSRKQAQNHTNGTTMIRCY